LGAQLIPTALREDPKLADKKRVAGGRHRSHIARRKQAGSERSVIWELKELAQADLPGSFVRAL
jgi:hypothetical protein